MRPTRSDWVAAALLTLAVSAAGPAAAQEGALLRWLAAAGMTGAGHLCEEAASCPVAATSSNGEKIEISGEGMLEIGEEGDEGSVRGRGSYRHTDAEGELLDVGTWTATRLLSFASYGASSSLPPDWRQGTAFIEIRMVSRSSGQVRQATMELGSLLDDPVTPAPAGSIDGIRLDVEPGPNFDTPINPRPTLFIVVVGADDDDNGDREPPGEGGGFLGATLFYSWVFSPLANPVEGPTRFEVAPGVELVGVTAGSVDVDFSADKLRLTWRRDIFFTSASFNGLVFSDVMGTVAPFGNVTIEPTQSTVMGFTPARIGGDGDNLRLDFSGLMVRAGEVLCLNIGSAGGG